MAIKTTKVQSNLTPEKAIQVCSPSLLDFGNYDFDKWMILKGYDLNEVKFSPNESFEIICTEKG